MDDQSTQTIQPIQESTDIRLIEWGFVLMVLWIITFIALNLAGGADVPLMVAVALFINIVSSIASPILFILALRLRKSGFSIAGIVISLLLLILSIIIVFPSLFSS